MILTAITAITDHSSQQSMQTPCPFFKVYY